MNGYSRCSIRTHACACTHTHTHTHSKIFSSSKQKRETSQFATTWLDSEDIVLRHWTLDVGHWTVDIVLSQRKTVTIWSNLCLESKETTLSSEETGGWQGWESLVKAVKTYRLSLVKIYFLERNVQHAIYSYSTVCLKV